MSDAPVSLTARPAIIAVAPNGARRSKNDHPQTPFTPKEIAADAAACCGAGATMIHLHVRDTNGGHSLDPATYRDAIESIRVELGERMLVQVSTELAGIYEAADQMRLVEALQPDAFSIAIRELLPDTGVIERASAFLGRACERGTAIQYILYSPEDVQRYGRLLRDGVIPDSPQMPLLVLGRHVEGGARVADLSAFVDALPQTIPFMVCAFGGEEPKIMQEVLRAGGHCRVGFENNTALSDGRRAPSNAAIVAETVASAQGIARPVADVGQTYALLGARKDK